MKLSIVSAVLDSHEVVRRQLLHYERMGLSDDVQIIMIDDGSKEPIDFKTKLKNFGYRRTNNTSPWSEHIARNVGVRIAGGDYLFMVDIDYIIPHQTIDKILKFTGDRMDIQRCFGVLDEHGCICADDVTLCRYGLKKRWLGGKVIPGHRSQYVMHRDVFREIGGYREDLAGTAHPLGGGAGQVFNNRWRKLCKKGIRKASEKRADVFMFPVGKFTRWGESNPLGLFHDLKRYPCAI